MTETPFWALRAGVFGFTDPALPALVALTACEHMRRKESSSESPKRAPLSLAATASAGAATIGLRRTVDFSEAFVFSLFCVTKGPMTKCYE